MSAVTAEKAPLDDIMLAMDVVDTLRHNQDLVTRELSAEERETQLIEKLRALYHQQGIEVPDSILREGVAALAQSRFVYTPPKPSFGVALARIYVSRRKWGRVVLAAGLALLLLLGGYFLVYRPYQASLVEQARIELAETLPAEMDTLFGTISGEAKVQQAVTDAGALVARGKAAASEGDRAGAETAIAGLKTIRDTLRLEYALTIVSRPGAASGFYRIPDDSPGARNYYLVVEALGKDGKPLSLPILNEETHTTETVAIWGQRVPEATYQQVAADKSDDGIIETYRMGTKSFGYLVPDYAMPVLEGAVTQWE